MPFCRSLVPILAIVALVSSQAGAVLFSTDTDTGNGADAFIRGGSSANSNAGSSGSITLKNAGNLSFNRKGYARFDISGADRPFVDANLDVVVSTNNSGGGSATPQNFVVNVYGLHNADAGENWIETGAGGITWNNAPGNVNSNRMDSNVSFLGTFNVASSDTSGSTVNFNNQSLTTFLNQDTEGNATVILQRESNTGGGGANLVFASNNHGSLAAPAISGNTEGDLRTITTADGNGADTYVRLGQPNNNFGGATQVVIKDANNGSTTRKGYLRFDLSSITQEALQAGLTLDISTNNQGGNNGTIPAEFQNVQVYGLTDESLDNWNEGTIDFDNAPGNQAGDGLNGSLTTLLGTFNVEDNAGGSVIFANQNLVDFINADTNGLATLILRRNGGSGSANLGFASKENSTLNAPRLDVVTEAVPEPATATLALLSLGGLMMRRKRTA